MTTMILACATLACLASLAPQDSPREIAARIPLPGLAPVELPKWREHLLPTEAELAFEAIDWIPDFATGMKRAAAEGKPLLFWAMNGHPLGCT